MSSLSVVFPLPPSPDTAGGISPVYLIAPAIETADCLPSTLPCTLCMLVPDLLSVGLRSVAKVTCLILLCGDGGNSLLSTEEKEVASLSVRLRLKMSLLSVVFPLPPPPVTAGGSNPVYLLAPATERADCLPFTLPCTSCVLVRALLSIG